jgi:hypothetical protein
MDTKGVGLVAVMVFLGIFGVVLGTGPVYDHNRAVQEHVPANATIQETDIDMKEDDDGDKSYRPVITYEYTVDGETYTADNIFPGRTTRWDGSRSWAENIVDEYEVGSNEKVSGDPVVINYSPNDPNKAYLRNDDGWPDSWWLGAGYAVIIFVAGIYLIRVGFRRWQQRKLIRDTPTENARSLSIGPSELKGKAVTEDMSPARAPFSDEECVLAKYEVKEYREDNDDDGGGSWHTIDEDVLHQPFYVTDGTGYVLVEPHDEATYDLDPEDWETTYVDSSEQGPAPIQQFVQANDSLSFPSDRGGKDHDRKYRQNLIRLDESVYVYGTVQPRDEVEVGADNAGRLTVRKVTDDSMREPMFMISDDEEKDLINRREWALWRLPVGIIFMGTGFGIAMFMFAPMLGLDVPILF